MIDMEAIRNRAKQAKAKASGALGEMKQKSEELEKKSECREEVKAGSSASVIQKQLDESSARQVEILGQVLDKAAMEQLAANQEKLDEMVKGKIAEAMSAGAEGVMHQLFGEDMGVIAAALETLAMEDSDDEDDVIVMDEEWEAHIHAVMDEAIGRVLALPESKCIPYGDDRSRWKHFGILLSGIISTLNDHDLSCMDVEEHTPVLEQHIVSLVRRSWGIDGRSDLLAMLNYLMNEGYTLRYQMFASASSPEELMDEDIDEEERNQTARVWHFVQHYKIKYAPQFLSGWDIGRAAMITRWGCYLGWITEGEAEGILWQLSEKAWENLSGWREFAASYIFGGVMWKLLSGAYDTESYIGCLADASVSLLMGEAGEGGEWMTFPWPEKRKIGFIF